MVNVKANGLGSVLCIILYTSQHFSSSLGAALPQPSCQTISPPYQNISLLELPSPTPVLLGSEARPKTPKAMPQAASSRDLKFQPLMDFGSSACYNWPAIDATGYISEGISKKPDSKNYCHGTHELDNNNVYVRRRCNRGWCAYLYGYYFPKDVAPLSSHRHDWEHVIVWTKSVVLSYVEDGKMKVEYNNERIEYLGTTAHGKWDIRPLNIPNKRTNPRMEGNRVLVVYDRTSDPWDTHHISFADQSYKNVKNYKKKWFRGDLISWNKMDSKVRNVLNLANFGSAHCALIDQDFTRELIKSMPSGVREGGFDCAHDEQPATSAD